MRRSSALTPAIVIAAAIGLALAGCTSGASPSPAPTGSGGLIPTAGPSADPSVDPGAGLPDCTAIARAASALLEGLEYSERLSTVELPAEAYAQRLCVFSTADETAQIGITIAAVALLPTEIELYATMPTSVADARLVDGQVLQRYSLADDPAGPLSGAISLFDSTVTVTVQGFTTTGSLPDALPRLTVPAATDALFEVRTLLP